MSSEDELRELAVEALRVSDGDVLVVSAPAEDPQDLAVVLRNLRRFFHDNGREVTVLVVAPGYDLSVLGDDELAAAGLQRIPSARRV